MKLKSFQELMEKRLTKEEIEVIEKLAEKEHIQNLLDPRVTTFKHKCILFGDDSMFIYDTLDEDGILYQDADRHEDFPSDHEGMCCIDNGEGLEMRHYYDYDSYPQCTRIPVKYCPECGYKKGE